MLARVIINVFYMIVTLIVFRAVVLAGTGIWMMVKDIAAGANSKLVTARTR